MLHLSIARVADMLSVVGGANDAVTGAGIREFISDLKRFEWVRVIGVDEHAWRHTKYGTR